MNSRDPRRAGQDPHDAQDYVLGPDGKPLTDRYGRPIRRRPATGVPLDRRRASEPPRHTPPRHEQPRRERSRQEPPRYEHPGQEPPRRVPPRLAPQYQASQRPAPQYQTPQYQTPPRQAPQQPYYPPQSAPQHSAPQQGHYRPPSAPPRPARRKKRGNPFAKTLGCGGLVLLTIIALILCFGLWADSKLTRSDALDYQHVPDTSGTNWLLVGSDSRVGLTEEEQQRLGTGGDVGSSRTDTIMLLHIPTHGTAKLVSIPRDSYVDIPGFGMDKINAAFSYGGPQLLGQTIEQWSGLRIDRYAEIGMGGLANVVDAAGGVDICVKEPMYDDLAGIALDPGCQNLTGGDALGYVRTRATAMGDLDRVARQREFFAALLHKITDPSTLLNPLRVIPLINHTAQSFVVGKRDHVWNLARVALAMGKDVETTTIPIDGFQDTAVGNVVLWNDAETAALWDSLR